MGASLPAAPATATTAVLTSGPLGAVVPRELRPEAKTPRHAESRRAAFLSAPERIRTSDLRFRRPRLWRPPLECLHRGASRIDFEPSVVQHDPQSMQALRLGVAQQDPGPISHGPVAVNGSRRAQQAHGYARPAHRSEVSIAVTRPTVVIRVTVTTIVLGDAVAGCRSRLRGGRRSRLGLRSGRGGGCGRMGWR